MEECAWGRLHRETSVSISFPERSLAIPIRALFGFGIPAEHINPLEIPSQASTLQPASPSPSRFKHICAPPSPRRAKKKTNQHSPASHPPHPGYNVRFKKLKSSACRRLITAGATNSSSLKRFDSHVGNQYVPDIQLEKVAHTLPKQWDFG